MKEIIVPKNTFLNDVYEDYGMISWRIRDLKSFFPFLNYDAIKRKVYHYRKQQLLKRTTNSKYRLTQKAIDRLAYWEQQNA